MASSTSSTRGITADYITSEGGLKDDFTVEDEYIYDDYDSEPLLTSQADMELSRQYQGRKYLLLRQNQADANTIIPMRCRSRRCALRVFMVLFLSGIGVLCGYFITATYLHACEQALFHQTESNGFDTHFVNQISSKSIERFLRNFTKVPHPGGSKISMEQAQYIAKEWKSYGLDKVELKKYEVLLSFPLRPGRASIVAENGSTLFKAQEKEKILQQDENHPDALPPFNAYSNSGHVTARLVYVNYARVEDFTKLREMNINISGRIVIAKYGKIYRGDKATIAAAEGAVGLILYTDPTDYSPEGPALTYPHSWWLPPSGVQRGTLLNLEEGDPQTPGYPSRDAMYRKPQETLSLPSIPVYPVSYADAKRFMELLTGNEAPKDWQGGLKIKYNITMANNDKRNVTLDIAMKSEKKAVYNVIGTINGKYEPDRLVLLGNHRDAWVFGAADASSGTAVLMEIAKRLGELKKEGWRPRRSMVLCSWGAEEHGLLGSTEWAEDFANLLSNRAVAYLNVDIAVEGNFSLKVQSSPLLDLAFMNATKKVSPPESNKSYDTLYEDWKNKFPDKENPNLPDVKKVGSGSDHSCAYFRLGVPSIIFRYTYDKNKWSVSSYPVYHSVHDSFQWMKNFVDREFEYHRTLAQLWLQFGLTLADQALLPFDATRYADKLTYYAKDIKTKYEKILSTHNITLDHFISAVSNFSRAASSFQVYLAKVDQSNPLKLRMANDRLMQLERAFINPQGLPGRPYMRHMVLAPSAHNQYAGSSFPGLVDTVYSVQYSEKKDWGLVKRELSTVIFYIESATNVMLLESM